MLPLKELNKIHTMKVEPESENVFSTSYSEPSTFGMPDNSHKKKSISDLGTARNEIEKEHFERKLAAEHRNKIYLDILLNRNSHEIPSRFAFYSLSSIFLCIILTGFVTIIPVHDVLDKSRDMSQYWWESMIQAVSYFASCCVYMLLNCSYWTNISLIRTFKNFFIFFGWTALVSSILIVGFNIYWIYGMNLRFPAPFMGMLLAYPCINLAFIPLWLTFPKHWRKEKDIRQKFQYFIFSIWVNMFITMIYSFYTTVFVAVPVEYQWIAAITLIPLREFNLWLQKKVCYKAAGERDTSIAITSGHNINNRHCFFILVVLGTIATDLTSYVILIVASGVNLYLGLRIVWIKYKNGFNADNQTKAIEILIELVLNESVELIVPIAFILCFIIAYFGPNAEIIGTVKSEYWHHVPVKHVQLFCGNLGIFLLAETFTFLFSFILLKLTYGINIMKALIVTQREYWLLMAVNTGYTIQMVSIAMQIKLGTYNQ